MFQVRYKIKLRRVLIWLVFISIIFYISQIILSQFIGSANDKLPILLWWTPLMAPNEEVITCGKYRCLLTKDRNYRDVARIASVLFYGSRLDMNDLPVPKTDHWAVFHEESPRSSSLFVDNKTHAVFDLVSTFSRNSDFPITLQYLENFDSITDNTHCIDVEEKNKFLVELAPVLYIQSDCDTPNDRDSYVQELMNYIQVDSYGQCLKNRDFPKELQTIDPSDLYNKDLLNFIARYKFVLGIENAICNDYITEKLWRPLIVGSIPIYLGSPSVQDWLPNSKSAILVKDFKSPKELANFIHAINKSDTMYRQYLSHKKAIVTNVLLKETLNKGKFGLDFGTDHPIPAFECFVCNAVGEGFVTKRSHVYDCVKPANSWRIFWQKGECESKVFNELVTSGTSKNFNKC